MLPKINPVVRSTETCTTRTKRVDDVEPVLGWTEQRERVGPVAVEVTRDGKIAGMLPRGFQEKAVAEGDAEAIWTVATLALLMEEFGVNGSSAPGETLSLDPDRREPEPRISPR